MKHLCCLFALWLLVGCGSSASQSDTARAATDTLAPADSSTFVPRPAHALYHWKTVFDPTPEEWDFLRKHQVERLYVRFFDVDINFEQPVEEGYPVIPIATAIFHQRPDSTMEVVPTVYITLEALRKIKEVDKIIPYANAMVERIRRMAAANKIGNIQQVQIDCDWTPSTEADYFALLRQMRSQLRKQGIALSSTIRLWQLARPTPPVDCGVLMCYNSGSITQPDVYNSILDPNDMLPYLPRLADYSLPLDYAYPVFGWSVWFRDGKFKALIRETDCSDPDRYTPLKENNYRVRTEHYIVEKQLKPGDVVRVELPSFEAIREVQQAVEKYAPRDSSSVILYHLDQNNLKKYSSDEIDSLYSAR